MLPPFTCFAKFYEREIDVLTTIRNERYIGIISQWLWCFTEDLIKMSHQSTNNSSEEEMTILVIFTDSPFWLFAIKATDKSWIVCKMIILSQDAISVVQWGVSAICRILHDPVSIKHLNNKKKKGEVMSSMRTQLKLLMKT